MSDQQQLPGTVAAPEAAARAQAAQAGLVFAAWHGRQARPGAVKYTADRQALICKRLALGYDAEDLIALVRWAYESDHPRARWLRGEDPKARGQTWLDLANLLVEAKLGARVQMAREWLAGVQGRAPLTSTRGEDLSGTAQRGAFADRRSPARGIRR